MKKNLWPAIAIVLLFALHAFAADPATVQSFTPQGTAKNIRQVKTRFSQPMVSFGDPRAAAPFGVDCAVKGSGLWIDERNWVYDFERDLPGGVKCTFTLKPDIKTLNGETVGGTRQFAFSTGGPAIIESRPGSGATISEDQVFVLALDAPATADSIEQHTFCETPGSSQRIGVRLITGDQRQAILDTQRYFLESYLRRTSGEHDSGSADWKRKLQALRNDAQSPIVVLQCKLRFPAEAAVRLVWERGIMSLSGVATAKDKVLSFKTRPAFHATFTCNRANKDAHCTPVLPMNLTFSAPVARSAAQQIRLEGSDGKKYPPKIGDAKADYVSRVQFAGPFPESASFRLIVPHDIKDDAGRALANAGSFPLTVRTDQDPPLAKFGADFGIIELKAGGLLPVTLRNLEPQVKAGLLALNSGAEQKAAASAPIPGRVLAVDSTYAADIVSWLRRVHEVRRNVWEDVKGKGRVLKYPRGSRSVFGSDVHPRHFNLPLADDGKAFEVVGIPLKHPGFYVVELASPRLGASLLGKHKPYYVQSAALVTNLSAHLKLGRESSLVWVTALDSGQPVAGAAVDVLDCHGRSYWHGKTDAHGIARVDHALPQTDALPGCLEQYDRQYIVTARAGDDMTFVMSEWNEGIQPWRFNLPQGSYQGPYIATTVFDRSLLRAGETVHMKLFVRQHTGSGFAFVPRQKLENRVVIVHQGSGERYEVPVTWDDHGRASGEWTIPKNAKQGDYKISVLDRLGLKPQRKQPNQRDAGGFRVESFRVPTMKAIVKPADGALINARSATFDVQLSYLSGGGASLAPIALRIMVMPRDVSFPDYDGFTFANGNVIEGMTRSGGGEQDVEAAAAASKPLGTLTGKLDQAGGGRFTIDDLPQSAEPRTLLTELEYRDANGETRTAATRVGLWPAAIVLGIKPDGWAMSKDQFKFQVAALDLDGKPRAGVAVHVDLFQRETYSHRKRLIGGFYAYENVTEVKRVGSACVGTTDAHGLLLCNAKSPVSGNVVLRAAAQDGGGNTAYANRDVWVAGSADWWFDMSDSDRMDLLPEKKHYEPGDTATFQVRMPFREATALVTVEREGVIDSFVTHLSGKAPVVKVPITGNYAPNVFVSVLAVRGRVAGVQPTAMIDLGKPAFKLGMAEINVGWRAHQLKVRVTTDHDVYKVRDKAQVTVKVTRADGSAAPAGTEVAIAAVDQGLLELWPNKSWKLLDAMMQRRSTEVETATAQMQVVGKRHFGRKAQPAGGGGGGRLPARELFDTLLYWNAKVTPGADGTATVTVPLNDSLTSFRIVAIADAGAGLFGSGDATIRSTQDVMLLSGLPQMVREGDRLDAGFTVRNASDAPLAVGIGAAVVEKTNGAGALHRPDLATHAIVLQPGQAQQVGWNFTVPKRADALDWFAAVVAKTAAGKDVASDLIHVTQKVIPAVPVRILQASITQLDRPIELRLQRPADALPGRGGVRVGLSPQLASGLASVRDYMSTYPYSCFEQQTSKAVALQDLEAWGNLMRQLPGYLDDDGLLKYFPGMNHGSDVLTAYVLTISAAAGWKLPDEQLARMSAGLRAFVQGKIVRRSGVRAPDLALRKIAALAALAARDPKLDPHLLDSIAIEPGRWPTSAVLDWHDLLSHATRIPERAKRLADAENIIRTRLDLRGSVLRFSTANSDFLWWLMASGAVNANRTILEFVDDPDWRSDMPRLVRGALERRHGGHWDTTVANAWGVLALRRFSQKFESAPVTGTTQAKFAGQSYDFDWHAKPKGDSVDFAWPKQPAKLTLMQHGTGKPWVTVQSRAAVPLKAPLASGFTITRSVTPVQQEKTGIWSEGDVARVKLVINAQADMTWVVVRDPVPPGATILGSGLGGDSHILTQGENDSSNLWPAFEERTADSYRAYYDYVPKGKWTVEYTVRLNNAGRFELPPTRVEALYAPGTFGEVPNAVMTVTQ